ncbi:MAG: hypothetical protein KDA60_21740, partial [Planctomycetales bacterium]|nr:hypothetical protein [Planctomycetales bacterium]
PWDDSKQIIPVVIRQLNDYLGHRPVPALETQKHEPYPHEYVRPIPVYIEGAGAAAGHYHEIVTRTIDLLRATPLDILQHAYFDIDALEELAIDPRAYDFDHPAHRRPNHQFGEWDPDHIDNKGRYRRFIVRNVTVSAILERVELTPDIDHDELMFEASAVLAGTILMASGISGRGPDTHHSTVTLMTLLPIIAQYRDQYYQHLLVTLDGAHGERLRREEIDLRQPFGGARQDLNARLGKLRATQAERIKLAKVFSRMGHLDAALAQAETVDVASARMTCRIECGMVAAHQAIDRGELEAATQHMEEAYGTLRRGIDCGAIIDPWNILGFDANYSLFPATENTVHDHRADELVELIERVFNLCSRLWSEAAAANDLSVVARVSHQFETIANWWFQFAVHEVSSVDASNALENYHAAQAVAAALKTWYEKGATPGDIAFWAPRVESFESPRAYAFVIETLLAQRDYASARSLLVHWLDQAPRVALEHGETSFHELATRWMLEVTDPRQATDETDSAESSTPGIAPPTARHNWHRIRRFFDFLEANSNEYWKVPRFELGSDAPVDSDRETFAGEATEEAGDEDDLFGAAYENVVYKDSTADGMEGSIYENDESSFDELERERERIDDRLAFIRTMARLWTLSAAAVGRGFAAGDGTSTDQASDADVEDIESVLGKVRD